MKIDLVEWAKQQDIDPDDPATFYSMFKENRKIRKIIHCFIKLSILCVSGYIMTFKVLDFLQSLRCVDAPGTSRSRWRIWWAGGCGCQARAAAGRLLQEPVCGRDQLLRISPRWTRGTPRPPAASRCSTV